MKTRSKTTTTPQPSKEDKKKKKQKSSSTTITENKEEKSKEEEKKPHEEEDDDDTNDDDWENIDSVETVIIEFTETYERCPYNMEIVWKSSKKEGCYNSMEMACGAMYESYDPCRKKFIPALRVTATRATNMKVLLIRFLHPNDRTWPYPTVPMIADAFSSVNGKHPTIESVDDVEDGGNEFTVTFEHENNNENKNLQDGNTAAAGKKRSMKRKRKSFTNKLDCSKFDMRKKTKIHFQLETESEVDRRAATHN